MISNNEVVYNFEDSDSKVRKYVLQSLTLTTSYFNVTVSSFAFLTAMISLFRWNILCRSEQSLVMLASKK